MQQSSKDSIHFACWMVHLFTASGLICGLLSLHYALDAHYREAFLLILVSIAIDGVDGYFARRFEVAQVLPEFDGALLDNLVDYVNYAFVPAVMVYSGNFLAPDLRSTGASAILIASVYQFSRKDAKTADHFFLRFPSYWSIVVLYLFLVQTSTFTNATLVGLFALLSFVPIKYIYPTRFKEAARFADSSSWIPKLFLALTFLWGGSLAILLIRHPEEHPLILGLNLGYLAIYFIASLRENITR